MLAFSTLLTTVDQCWSVDIILFLFSNLIQGYNRTPCIKIDCSISQYRDIIKIKIKKSTLNVLLYSLL